MRNDGYADMAPQLCETIILARESQRPVYISAGGSKRHIIGRQCDAQVLDVSTHRGIIDYQPAELVITAR
ncbi:MAG: glycolate oxidase subunit GlcE, partial [Gammaproteobacteria bacterium]|nr:glycolate oxidase subunit GlcE [Gammaproteobacteria bacterium]